MNIKYRIRRRKSGSEEQYYVDYKRFKDGDNLDNIEWMGGFYAKTEEEARKLIETHREYESLRLKLQMSEEVIYDETLEIALND
jgi:hypothetical protein